MTIKTKIAAVAMAAAMTVAAGSASAHTYIITIIDSAHDQQARVGGPFTPHFGYTGGPVQSWGFGLSQVGSGGWLDFYTDGQSLVNEATSSGNFFYQTTTPFYSLINNQLSFTAPVNGPPELYRLVNGGSLTITAIPEPATWAMMILGMGVAGAALRVRRRKVVFAA